MFNERNNQSPNNVTERISSIFNSNQQTINVKKLLGKGAFGQCFQVSICSNDSSKSNDYALKFITGEIYSLKRDLIDREISIHKTLTNKYIVKLLKVNIDPDKNDVHMIMELCDNGSLCDFINANGHESISIQYRNRICSSIFKAVWFLHNDHFIIHRDIKPANILLNGKMIAKITDFGLAIYANKDEINQKKICGTPHYLAPEVFQQEGHSYQSDIWAVGITLYYLITGTTPFEEKFGTGFTINQTLSRIFNNIMCGQYKFPKHIPRSTKNLIKQMLQRDPHKRPNLAHLIKQKFWPSKSSYLETPDEDVKPVEEFNVSMDSITFISDQPVIDALVILSKKYEQVSKSLIYILWIDKWGLKSFSELYYSLSNGCYGGNVSNVKGILLTTDNKEIQFENNDLTLNSSLTHKLNDLNKHQIIYHYEYLVKLLRPFTIPRYIITSFIDSIKYFYKLNSLIDIDRSTTKSVVNSVFVIKWCFHSDSIILVLNNGMWQVTLWDHNKMLVYRNIALFYTALSQKFDIIDDIQHWCNNQKNQKYLDVIRTLLYGVI